MKKGLLIIGILLIGLIVVGFTFEKETKPKDDTRLIIEHTYKTYMSPPCYEEADATNHLEDSDIEMAKQLEYEPNDTCTEEELAPIKEKIIVSFLHDLGILKTEWANW